MRGNARRSPEAGEYLFDHAVSGKGSFLEARHGEVYVLPFTVRRRRDDVLISHANWK